MIDNQQNYLILYTYIYFISQIKTIISLFLPIIRWFMILVFNYRKYYFNNKESMNKLQCFIEANSVLCSTYNFEGKPEGNMIHKSLFPEFFIKSSYSDDDPYIFCTSNTFDKIIKINDVQKFKKIDLKEIQEKEKLNMLTKKKDYEEEFESSSESDEEDEISSSIKYLVKTTSEYSGYNRYCVRDIKISNDHVFNQKQDELFIKLMNFYNENKFAKILISGSMGTGKSYFSYILARKLGCYLCDSFDPTEPSESLTNLYTSKKLSGTQPLIVLIDEIDTIIMKIHQGKIQQHKHYPILTKDKMSWNSFLDKIDYGLFPNLILVMTSNLERDKINKYDKSYLRDGRINIYSHF
tara:strand:+ start:633 stop:1688 length:1056 start_codon:yes stop_codon:yes gene_type:complete